MAQQGSNPFEVPNRETTPSTTKDQDNKPIGTNPFDLPTGANATPTTAPAPAPRPITPSPANTEEDNPDNANPFDINQSSNTPSTTTSPTAPSTAPPGNSNPFEVNRLQPLQPTQTNSAPAPVLQPNTPQKSKSNRNFLFWSSVFSLLLLTILLTLYKPLINQIYRAFLNDNMLKLKHREQGSVLNLPFSLLYLSFFGNAGLFVYLIIHHYGWQSSSHLSLLLWCILGVFAVFFIKHVALRVVGLIFPINKELRQYSFTIVVFNIILGILLVPVNLLIAYGPRELPKYLIWGLLGSVLLLYGFRIIRSLLIASRYISLHKFHFFMYLCTVEIAPTLVLVKILLLLQAGAY